MKRIILWIICALCAWDASAVMQEGNVRSLARKGRPGTPIEGAIVRVRGSHNAVQSRPNGDFSLLLQNLQNGDPYTIASITKSGYEPAEQGLIGKRIPCSESVPLEIILANTGELQAEKEAIAAKARENVEIYYQTRLAALEKQLAAKQMTEQEYSRRLEELEGQYERFEPLLQTMSDRFARTDYGRLDSLTALIQESIENGNPEEAERLVREKGDLEQRENAIRAQEEQISRAQQTLDESQAQLDQQRALTTQQKRELGDDYYRMYSAFLSRFQNDSAATYILRRAALDTTDVDYQLQAGQFVKEIMADYPQAQRFFERAYRICETQYGEMSGQMATTCHELGSVHKAQGDLDGAALWYERALRIKEKVRGKDAPAVAETLNNIGELYRAKKDLKQAMNCHKRALKIREKAFDAKHLAVAESKNNIAGVLYQQGQIAKAEKLFREVREVYAQNPKTPPMQVAGNYNNLGAISYQYGRYAEAAEYFRMALEIYTKVLGEAHPRTRATVNNMQICQQKTDK